jgi:acyl CoA:acetate/3-ketoacid CoA transferase alpha subunit
MGLALSFAEALQAARRAIPTIITPKAMGTTAETGVHTQQQHSSVEAAAAKAIPCAAKTC